jgi:cellulose synthase/poly-beta-1,6-N-acetylglucosamine synthase-like glycosyltransferase
MEESARSDPGYGADHYPVAEKRAEFLGDYSRFSDHLSRKVESDSQLCDDERIDVVIPTTGEPALHRCLKSIGENVRVNKVILVGPSSVQLVLSETEDMKFVICDERNVGLARREGLEYVTTRFYASIDSDVIVNREWFKWCMACVKEDNVGACQGLLRNVGKHSNRMLQHVAKRGIYVDLANTILRSSVVRAVGMPEKRYGEDRELRSRIEKAGYKWVMSTNVVCTHLVSDVDSWRHEARWAAVSGLDPVSCFQIVAWALTKGLLEYGATDCLFVLARELFRLFGFSVYLKRKLRR